MGSVKGKRQIGRSRRRCEDTTKINLRETGWGDMHRSHLVQGTDQWRALVNTVMNIWVPQNIGKFLNSRITGGFSRRVQPHGVSWLLLLLLLLLFIYCCFYSWETFLTLFNLREHIF
jgi:hypothetical protein